MAVDSLVHFGDFWRARAKVTFDATYDGNGYSGFIRNGDEPVRDLTFEFGEPIRVFGCEACGKVELHGKRVVLRDTLAPGAFASFTAAIGSAQPGATPGPAHP